MTASKDSQKYIKSFMEMLRSHQWVDQPTSAYLHHELHSNDVVERLDHTTAAEMVQRPPGTSEGTPGAATTGLRGGATIAVATTAHGLNQV